MTIAEKLLRAKTDIDEAHEAGYGKGYNEGAEQVNRTLFGVYILKDTVDVEALISEYGFFEEEFTGKGVYAYFLDNYGMSYKYSPVDKFRLYNNLDGYDSLEFRSGILADQGGNLMEFLLYYAPASWPSLAAQYGYLYDGEYAYEYDTKITTELQSKIITFTQPIVVSQEIYDVINMITDNSLAIADIAKKTGAKVRDTNFWDRFIIGNNFTYVFAHRGWDDSTFRPTRNINVSNAKYMFGCTKSQNAYYAFISNLETILAANDVYIIFNTSELEATFLYCSQLLKVGRIKFNKSVTNLKNTFRSCRQLKEINVPIPVNDTTVFNTAFDYCNSLVEVRFEGVIGTSGLDLQHSTVLSKASWQNIIGCLSADTSGLSMTGSLASVNKAFETSEGANDGSTSTEWLDLIATKPNWTIKLV